MILQARSVSTQLYDIPAKKEKINRTEKGNSFTSITIPLNPIETVPEIQCNTDLVIIALLFSTMQAKT